MRIRTFAVLENMLKFTKVRLLCHEEYKIQNLNKHSLSECPISQKCLCPVRKVSLCWLQTVFYSVTFSIWFRIYQGKLYFLHLHQTED